MEQRPLLRYFPRLAEQIRFSILGDYPTPIQPLSELLQQSVPASDAFIKRDDLSATIYGGNKVRTLEVLFGAALARGATRIYSTGAFGSNHATATVLHAPRVGLQSGAVLFPQPPSGTARDNLEVVASRADDLVLLRHWSELPLHMWRLRTRRKVSVMPPGGATPLGALGYVSAALELAEQVREQRLPSPRQLVLGVGSTCTTAGLLVGLRVARLLGIAFQDRLPQVIAVRVSPWPVTSALRIVHLARRTAALLANLSGSRQLEFTFGELRSGLTLDRRFFGAGYGKVTSSGLAAIRDFGEFGRTALDTTYSAKSAAGLLACLRERQGPTVYWATKSSRPLPDIAPAKLSALPDSIQSWLSQGLASTVKAAQ